MLSGQPEQFKINDQGQILYQAKAGNPLPGEAVAVLRKGASVLAPEVELLSSGPAAALDAKAAKEFLQSWLSAHIGATLEPLIALQNDPELTTPVKEIAEKVFDSLGILPREALGDLIAQLDQDTRRVLRAKRIRLGPILVFQPDLNKPAAVRLRGLLWSLFNDKPLPAPLPNDGVVSFKIDPKAADPEFHQVIGYPVYGPRAIRIDMLDRVINSIYDQATAGKFKAQHEMAEWFGCPIQDLYDVLSAMGHVKIHDPLEEAAAAAAAAETELPATEEVAPAPAEAKAEEAPKADGEKQEQVKPELATFRLKKGKASGNASSGKPAQKKEASSARKAPKKGKRNKTEQRPKKVMSAEAKVNPEDSPFAILQQLQAKKNG